MFKYDYRCPECDTALQEDDESCPNCKATFVMEDDDVECPVCGSIISASAEICPHCGTRFEIIYEDEDYEEEEAEPEPEPEEPEEEEVEEIVEIVYEDEIPRGPQREIDDDMDLDAEILRIEQEELMEQERLRQEEEMARSMSPDQVDALFWEAVQDRDDITLLQQKDEEIALALDRMAPLLEATDTLGIDAYTSLRLRDRTYMALHQGDRRGALRNAAEALKLVEETIDDTLFYEQHFLRSIVERNEGPDGEKQRELLNEMTDLRSKKKYTEALDKLDELRNNLEKYEPGMQRASQSFRALTRAISVAERFLIDNRAARSIISHTSDLMLARRWDSIAELCEAGLEKIMHTMRERAGAELQRIRSETAMAKRKGESGDDFLLSAAAEAEALLAGEQYVQALDRISRYREESRRSKA